MTSKADACSKVAEGGVGESGDSSLLVHKVSGATSKIVILRHATSNLCRNTGVVAILTVDGIPVASGNITTAGSSIQHEAAAGSHVAAIIHTIPLFNGILCAQLGELTVTLDECELVG